MNTTLPFLNFSEAKIIPKYCIDDTRRDFQMASSIARGLPSIEEGPDRNNESVAIVCLGPSLLEDWEKIKNFKYIITCSGAHKFLIDRNIIPTWHVEGDPRSHKIELIGQPHKDVEYLIASVCHPKVFDHLQNYNVKIWHIYTGKDIKELPNSYPRGDWVFVGGSNVGLRALVLARFLGFKNFEIFGMDCSYPENHQGEHAIDHPNPAKIEDRVITEFGGLIYHTTGRMLHYAKDFFHEIEFLNDVKFTLHGVGLLQHMAWSGWRDTEGRSQRDKSVLAFKAPGVISEDYLKLNQELHKNNEFYGASGAKRADMVQYLSEEFNTQDILDYGCGKGLLAKNLSFSIKEYDPAIPGKDSPPLPADIVICTDVLEHIEPDYLKSVIGDIARCTKILGYFVIHTGPALKQLPDGRNAHLIQENRAWWYKKLNEYFSVDDMKESGQELHVIVTPKFEIPSSIAEIDELSSSVNYIEFEGIKFSNVNQNTKWRASTLRTKEPIMIEWIDSFHEDDIFLDIGANIGVYTLWAAKHKNIVTYAIEPESQNYAVLNQNIYLNNLDKIVKSYCIALSDKIGMDSLNLVEFVPGSSCHQYGRTLDFKNEPGKFVFSQGTVCLTLDFLIENNLIPQPNHIKIDVDGIEPKIITGSKNTLKNVKSLLIEVNQNLDEHLDMVNELVDLGFRFDIKQVKAAERKEGLFKGVAEYVFKRY